MFEITKNETHPILLSLGIELSWGNIEQASINLKAILSELNNMPFKLDDKLSHDIDTFEPVSTNYESTRYEHIDSALFKALSHFPTEKLITPVKQLAALYVYALLRPEQFKELPANPTCKTNKKVIGSTLIYLANSKSCLNDIEGYFPTKLDDLLTLVIEKSGPTHTQGAKLLLNVLTKIQGENEFLRISSKREASTNGRSANKVVEARKKRISIGGFTNVNQTTFLQSNQQSAQSPLIITAIDYEDTHLLKEQELKAYSQNLSTIDNNYIPTRPRVLIDSEANYFYHQLLVAFNQSQEPNMQKSLACTLLMLLLGLDFTWIKRVIFCNTLPARKLLKEKEIYISKEGHAKFLTASPNSAYQLKAENKPYIKSTEIQALTLPLPLSFVRIIDRIKPLLLSGRVLIRKDEFQKEFDKLKNKIPPEMRSRFTQTKLREYSFHLYYAQANRDEIIALLLKPCTPYILPSSCYYLSINANTLTNVHIKAFSYTFGDLSPFIPQSNSAYIGSKLCINFAPIETWLTSLADDVKQKLNKAYSLQDLIEAHNVYSLYSLTLLLILTGHRPFDEPFGKRNNFFIEEGMCIVSDKVVGKNHDIRIAPLCELATRQLRNYLKHIENFASRLEKYDVTQAQYIHGLVSPSLKQTLPLFIQIKENKHDVLSLQPVLAQDLKKFWHELHLPDNWYRHWMCQLLTEQGLERELINSYMGHFLKGQNMLSYYSSTRPTKVTQLLSNALNDVCKNLNIPIVEGLNKTKIADKESLNELMPRFPTKYITKKQKRMASKSKQKSKVIKEIDAFIEQEMPKFNDNFHIPLYEEQVAKIKQFCFEKPAYKMSLFIRKFNQKIKARARKGKRVPEFVFYSQESHEHSNLPGDLAVKIQQLIALEESLKNMLIQASFRTTKDYNKSLIVMYLFSLCIDLPFSVTLLDFRKLCKSEVQEDEIGYYVELSQKHEHVIRYYPNTLTLFQMLKLQTITPASSPNKNTLEKHSTNILASLNQGNPLIPKSINKLKEIAKVGWIFHGSPRNERRRKQEALFDLPPRVRQLKKVKKDD